MNKTIFPFRLKIPPFPYSLITKPDINNLFLVNTKH